MKNILIIVAVVVVAVAGYFMFMKNAPAPASDAPGDTSMPAGKLDINVVCEGALAYMTFPDGESAEKFVAECKAGEHPEVIEDYKVRMNLGDGAAI